MTSASCLHHPPGQRGFHPDPADPLWAIEAQRALGVAARGVREVVALRLWSRLTLADITRADVNRLPSLTVHARYATAIETLRQTLEAPCENPKT